MEKKLFSIYDEKSETFGQMVEFDQYGQAERWLSQVVSNTESMVHHYPEDYKLYLLGEINKTTGKLNSLEIPKLIGNAKSVKDALEKQQAKKEHQLSAVK